MIAIPAEADISDYGGEMTIRVTPDRWLAPGRRRVMIIVESLPADTAPVPEGYTPEEQRAIDEAAAKLTPEVWARALAAAPPMEQWPEEPLDLLGPPSQELLDYANGAEPAVPRTAGLGAGPGSARPQSQGPADRDTDGNGGDPHGDDLAGGGRHLDPAGRAAS